MKHPDTGNRLSPIRRVILLALGGVLLAAVVLTVTRALPHRVSVIIHLEGETIRNRETRTTITEGGETVVDARSRPGAAGDGSLRYSFWLNPAQHTLEVSARGCSSRSRHFNPSEVDVVTLAFSCE